MILKIKNKATVDNSSWSYFECDIIHSHHGLLKNLEVKGALSDAVIILTPSKMPKINKKNVKVLNLEVAKKHLRTIITDEVCYILNDNGKTIDKI